MFLDFKVDDRMAWKDLWVMRGNRELGQEPVRTLAFRFCTFGGLSSVRLGRPQRMVASLVKKRSLVVLFLWLLTT